MSLTVKEVSELKKIVARLKELLTKAKGASEKPTTSRSNSVRVRRSGKDLATFRRMLKAERKAGVPVAQLAKKHGVTASYIYQIG
jgi:hypothetical protein